MCECGGCLQECPCGDRCCPYCGCRTEDVTNYTEDCSDDCCASVVDVTDWPAPTGQDWSEVACLCGYESMPMPRGQAEQLAAAHMKARRQ